MAKQKEVKETNVTFAKGGNNHMFGPQKAGPETPGGTAHKTGGSGGEFAKGGSGKMFGFCGSESQQPGRTSAR